MVLFFRGLERNVIECVRVAQVGVLTCRCTLLHAFSELEVRFFHQTLFRGLAAISVPFKSLGSLSNDGGNGNGNVRKQLSDWLDEEKESCCTCGTARTLAHSFAVVCKTPT